jgi:hypothetical protein
MTITEITVNCNNVALIHERGHAVYSGKGEFYSNIKTGDEVEVAVTTYAHPGGSVHESISISKGGAWLALYSWDKLTLI